MPNTDTDQQSAGAHKPPKRIRNLNRLPTSSIPARLRYGDDANEDVTAPSRAGAAASQYMNQSIFSMIAAAGSRTDFNKRFDESSDSEVDEVLQGEQKTVGPSSKPTIAGGIATPGAGGPLLGATVELSSQGTKRRSEQKVGHTSSRQPFTKGGSPSQDQESRASARQGLSKSARSNPRDAPVMSRIISAEAELQVGGEGTGQLTPLIEQSQILDRPRSHSTPATILATRLMEIFGFSQPEEVLAEYPCWLLQSVLLQGYLYMTKNHICFYAYLPKKSNTVAKSGHLSKRGKSNPKYRRYWFTMKGDVLSYFSNPSDLYFPQGNIDLGFGISASLSAESGKDKDCKDFSVTTDHRTYHFRADSAASAREWVKSLQKTIFRSRNDGNSVKLALPLENVIDIEESPVVEFAETVKIRVVESEDSYAIDEYFFSFFSFAKDAMDLLANLIEKGTVQRTSAKLIKAQGHESKVSTTRTPIADLSKGDSRTARPARRRDPTAAIQDTTIDSNEILSNLAHDVDPQDNSPPRTSNDASPGNLRSDSERGRKAGHIHIVGGHDKPGERKPSISHQDDVDESYLQSTDRDTDSSLAPASPSAEARMSASQILTRSDVFHPPAVHRMDTLQSVSTEDFKPPPDRRLYGSDSESEGTDIDRAGMKKKRPVSGDRRTALQTEAADSESSDQRLVRNSSLQDLVKAGSYPLARAGAFAGYIKNRSTHMSKLLATESMSYLEKVSGMWAGGHQHYGENEGLVPDDRDVDPEDEEANVGHGDRFRAHFALSPTEKLQATYFAYFHRVLPLYGKIYISNRKFCFRSLLPGTRTKLVLPLRDIENVDKEKGFRFGYHGLVLVIRGHEELFFEFNNTDHRDDCTVTLLHGLESVRYMAESGLLAKEDDEEASAAKTEHRLLQEAHTRSAADKDVTSLSEKVVPSSHPEASSILFDDPKASIINFKPTTSLRITCLTIGSRGDVQPYIALCKGLLAEGHRPRIATHAEFGPWVRKHGIGFEPIGGDPAELMRICVENGMFTYSFLREASSKFRSWIDDLLSSAWKACQDSDILIESPSAMAGIHIAEALGIPYFRAFTMPWTRTRAYPHAFAVPEHKIGGAYNYFSYVMFDNVFWKGIAGQVNRWRKRELGLQSTNLDKMQPNKVPFLYNFSVQVVPPPLDYSDWVRVTGYWFLDEAEGYVPPDDLLRFIKRARQDKKKLVYIGFGSIVVSDPAALTKTVVDSVLKADVRCILSKGWSDRLGDPSAQKTEISLPSDIFQIKSAPHDWLFFQVDAAVHHGGAGTTGASLRAGIPTVIKPFFGDQFFFGGRVEDLGVGIYLKRINVSVFARALWEAVHSERMIVKARQIGRKIREEDGVAVAIQAMYRDLEYAKTLIKSRQATSKPAGDLSAATAQLNDEMSLLSSRGIGTLDYETEADLEGEESWTFVGGESDLDLEKRLQDLELGSAEVGTSSKHERQWRRPGGA